MMRMLHIALIGSLMLLPLGGFASGQVMTPAGARQALAAIPDDNGNAPVKCGLPILTTAIGNRAGLTPEQTNALAFVADRPVLQKSILAGHFRVHYDTAAVNGNNVPGLLDDQKVRIPGTANAYAESVAAIANRVYRLEVDQLGYAPPPGDGVLGGGPEYDIYVLELSNEYGEVMPEAPLDAKPDGGIYGTFMSIDNDFSFVSPIANRGLPGLRVTLAHEFHHAIQLGSYGYWTADQYYYEITSTWLEDVAFPGVDDYLNYLRSPNGHFAMPQVSFTSNNPIMYSRAIWGKYIQKKFGAGAMRSSWEFIRSRRPLEAVDAMLHANGTSLRAAFAEWSLWNFFTGRRADTVHYYDEGVRFPLVSQAPYDFTPPSRTITGDLEALAARYFLLYSGADTLNITVTNMALPASGPASAPFRYLISSTKVTEAYEALGAGLFGTLDVADASQWKTWCITSGGFAMAGLQEGLAFPSPFFADGNSSLSIPANSSPGTLTIFSSAMQLMYTSSSPPSSFFGQPVYLWNGRTASGAIAPSGIYLFVLSLPGRSVTGKFAVIRR